MNDELLTPCAQCAIKHLSAAIARFVLCNGEPEPGDLYVKTLVARAYVNLVESREGYRSHLEFSAGLLVLAEESCEDSEIMRGIRAYRLSEGPVGATGFDPLSSHYVMYLAHLAEAEREFPDVRTAVEREPFYRDNMNQTELRQAEVNYRLAQVGWLRKNHTAVGAGEGR